MSYINRNRPFIRQLILSCSLQIVRRRQGICYTIFCQWHHSYCASVCCSIYIIRLESFFLQCFDTVSLGYQTCKKYRLCNNLLSHGLSKLAPWTVFWLLQTPHHFIVESWLLRHCEVFVHHARKIHWLCAFECIQDLDCGIVCQGISLNVKLLKLWDQNWSISFLVYHFLDFSC